VDVMSRNVMGGTVGVSTPRISKYRPSNMPMGYADDTQPGIPIGNKMDSDGNLSGICKVFLTGGKNQHNATILLGPKGTGKSQFIGRQIWEFLNRGHDVFIIDVKSEYTSMVFEQRTRIPLRALKEAGLEPHKIPSDNLHILFPITAYNHRTRMGRKDAVRDIKLQYGNLWDWRDKETNEQVEMELGIFHKMDCNLDDMYIEAYGALFDKENTNKEQYMQSLGAMLEKPELNGEDKMTWGVLERTLELWLKSERMVRISYLSLKPKLLNMKARELATDDGFSLKGVMQRKRKNGLGNLWIFSLGAVNFSSDVITKALVAAQINGILEHTIPRANHNYEPVLIFEEADTLFEHWLTTRMLDDFENQHRRSNHIYAIYVFHRRENIPKILRGWSGEGNTFIELTKTNVEISDPTEPNGKKTVWVDGPGYALVKDAIHGYREQLVKLWPSPCQVGG